MINVGYFSNQFSSSKGHGISRIRFAKFLMSKGFEITAIEEGINNSLINKIEWNHKLTEFIKNYTWENCASKGMSVINKLLSLTK